jgi:hypothetical protein
LEDQAGDVRLIYIMANLRVESLNIKLNNVLKFTFYLTENAAMLLERPISQRRLGKQ